MATTILGVDPSRWQADLDTITAAITAGNKNIMYCDAPEPDMIGKVRMVVFYVPIPNHNLTLVYPGTPPDFAVYGDIPWGFSLMLSKIQQWNGVAAVSGWTASPNTSSNGMLDDQRAVLATFSRWGSLGSTVS